MKNNPINRLSTLLVGVLCALMLGSSWAAAEPTPGGTLVVGIDKVLRHFNGGIQGGLATNLASPQIFASPLRFGENWEPQPYLAEKWEIAEDGLSVTLHLVKNAVFHDGVPVTSKDVAFSIMTIKEHHAYQHLAPVDGVDTPDDHTAIIRMSNPYPAILLAMSPALLPIMPKHIYDTGEDMKTHPANMKPIGCGPFKFVENVSGEYFILEKFDKFFIPGRPYLDKIVYRVIPDVNNMVLSIERGDLDFLPAFYDVRAIQRLKKDNNLVVSERGYEGIGPVLWLAFNTQKKPLDDVRVRKAIAYAIDREFINGRLLEGVPENLYGPLVPSSPWASKNLEPYKIDLNKANALLEEAGYKKDKNGIRFALQADYEANATIQRTIAEYLRPQLKKIGIAVTVRSSPDLPSFAKRISNFEYDMTLSTVFNWSDPAIGINRTYLSTNIRRGVLWTNTQQYVNLKVDALLKQAASEMNPKKRSELYEEFQQIVLDEVPIFYISITPFRSVFRKGLDNLPLSIWGPFSPLDELQQKKRP